MSENGMREDSWEGRKMVTRGNEAKEMIRGKDRERFLEKYFIKKMLIT